jgi:hypothetical protein
MNISLVPTTESITSITDGLTTPPLDTLLTDNNEENRHDIEQLNNLAALEALMKHTHDESVEHSMEEHNNLVQSLTHDVNVSNDTTTETQNTLSFEHQSNTSS